MTMTLTASSISFVFLSLTDTDLVRWSFIHFVTRLSTRPFAS